MDVQLATSGSATPEDCGTDKSEFAVGKKFNTLHALDETICKFQSKILSSCGKEMHGQLIL